MSVSFKNAKFECKIFKSLQLEAFASKSLFQIIPRTLHVRTVLKETRI